MPKLKQRQELPESQPQHPGEVELPLAKDQPLFPHPEHQRGRSLPQPSWHKAQPAWEAAGLLRSHEAAVHAQVKAFPEPTDPPQCSCCSGTAAIGTGDCAGLEWLVPAAPGGTAAPERTAASACCHHCPARGEGAPLLLGFESLHPSPGSLQHLHHGSKVLHKIKELRTESCFSFCSFWQRR